ncbi:MAG: bifunctional serine/threonine-protein kinase/ABC transporter substrate-binding protein [Xenococcaceae cyanobacterium MO_188.B29]|nr:bifunctional serine/threonine-protein kinase/ABC transporter substrate-binding protein [Xenococcaceae cyanobacterium MO_188.B29]
MDNPERLNLMETLLKSGDIVNSRYRILQKLGHGGFGRTYLAEDSNRFNEYCVLKEFAPQLQGSFALTKAQELFEREAGILYRLQHPQIPQFRELFKYKNEDEGHLFLVQDYVEGQTYQNLYNKCIQEEKRFSEAEINQLLCQLLPVLEYIHSMGVIHRDISPDNIILRSEDEMPMLIDFGSIKEVATKAQSHLLEETSGAAIPPLFGTIIGKIGYAPPEQMERGIVFAHSDLYALAATAVVLLTGKEPRKLINPNNYEWNWQEEVSVSPKLEWILTTMLSPNPSDRFGSATEVRKTLEDISISIPEDRSNLPTTEMLSITDRPVSEESILSKIQIFSLLKPKFLLFAILMGSILLGSFWWWRNKDLTQVSQNPPTSDNSAQSKSSLSQRFSQGEKLLISQPTTLEKELAVTAFRQRDYHNAESLFSASLKQNTNDPEALIYLNNARIGAEKSYIIAVSIPIGSDLNGAKEMLRGVAQAQNQVNQAGGIKGIPLKVQIINDDNNPEVAKQVAQTLSDNPEILGVIGHYASNVTLATASIYQSGELVTISPISTSVKISKLSPYLFRTVPSDYIAGRGLAEYMLEEMKQQKVVVFYNSQSNYSQSLKSEFVTAVALGGGYIVGEFDLSNANFSAVNSLKQAMDKGAEVLMLAANTGTLDKALQVIQVNDRQLGLLGGDDVYTRKTLEIAGELAEDMVLAIPWHIQSNSDDEFSQVARKLWGGDVNWRTAMAYDATTALIAAIDRSPSRIGVQEVLSNHNFSTPGANSQIRFSPSGDRIQGIELVKIQASNRNSFDYEFAPITNK